MLHLPFHRLTSIDSRPDDDPPRVAELRVRLLDELLFLVQGKHRLFDPGGLVRWPLDSPWYGFLLPDREGQREGQQAIAVAVHGDVRQVQRALKDDGSLEGPEREDDLQGSPLSCKELLTALGEDLEPGGCIE